MVHIVSFALGCVVLLALLCQVLEGSSDGDAAAAAAASSEQSFPKHGAFRDMHAQVVARLDLLEKFADGFHPQHVHGGEDYAARQCTAATASAANSTETGIYLVITEYQFGNSGNQYIELTHGLWLAERFNATLVVRALVYVCLCTAPSSSSLFLSTGWCLSLNHSNP